MGRQLFARHRVLHLSQDVERRLTQRLHQLGLIEQKELLEELEHLRARLVEQRPVGAHLLDLRLGVGGILLGEDPVRGALEDRELLCDLGEFGDHLDRAGRGADDRNRAPGQVDTLGPVGRVERLPGERLQARNLRPLDLVEHSERADADIGDHFIADAGLEVPLGRRVVPMGGRDFGVEADMGIEFILAHAVLHIGPQLLVRSIRARPVRLRLEREGIERGGHIAGESRVAVIVPGAARSIGALEHDKILDARFLQPDRHADRPRPRADDGNPVFLRLGLGRAARFVVCHRRSSVSILLLRSAVPALSIA